MSLSPVEYLRHMLDETAFLAEWSQGLSTVSPSTCRPSPP